MSPEELIGADGIVEPSELGGSGLRGALEAILFVSGEPVSAERMSAVLGIGTSVIRAALEALADEYARDERGFQLREVAGGYRLYSHPVHAPVLEQFLLQSDTRRLTQAALETLAIVAYKQPVTRADVSAVRGVDSTGVLSTLVAKDLVRQVGHEEGPGQAILYGTTKRFLEAMGLKSVAGLPSLEDFAPDDKVREEIERHLRSEVEG